MSVNSFEFLMKEETQYICNGRVRNNLYDVPTYMYKLLLVSK